MKNSIKSLFLVSTLVVGLSSCGISGVHSTISNNISETKVVLSQNNFSVVGEAFGSSKSFYICGIGGLSHKGLRNNAIANMSKNANLTGAQTLTNITIHNTIRSWTPFVVEVTCTATANIIEFK